MNRNILILTALMMVACSDETPGQTAIETPEIDAAEMAPEAKSPASALGIGNKEKQYIEAMEVGFESQMKLYSRVSPEAAGLIKPVTFDEEDRDIIRCVIRGLKDEGMEKYLDMGIDANKNLNRLIEENPDLSMKTIESHPEAMKLLQGGEVMDSMDAVESEKSMAINKRCGTMSMMMDKMNESGIMEAMQSAR